MKNRSRLSLLIIYSILLLSTSCFHKEPPQNNQPYLIVLSLDGFRWDYPLQANTPTLDSLAEVGVHANIIPSYPSKTFPNHYAMATGLYPDHHGIVLNSFYAQDIEKQYRLSDRESVTNPDFYAGEPIWNTAEKQGVTAATLFWVGSEAPISHIRPTYWSIYDQKLPFESRIDSLFRWLSLPERKRPHLIMWYYHEPDGVGHHFGPHGAETIKEIEQLDHYLSMFFAKMKQLPEFDQLNFIVTSDHGMGELSPDRQVILDEVVDTALLERFDGWNPVWNLKVKPGQEKLVYNQLKSNPHLTVYKHDSIPSRLHYGTNPRTYDFTVEADSSYSIYWSWRVGDSYGTHGYDNKNTDMHAIFYAAGPAFKQGFRGGSFENVNLYALMANILQLQPVQTDGNIKKTEYMLIEQ